MKNPKGKKFPETLQNRLKILEDGGCWRQLARRRGIDFSSNDYLGFSQDEHLKAKVLEHFKELPLGSSASRLLRGHLESFERAESELADFCSRESALLFTSGYQANVGLLSALLGPEDWVFSDQYNHASLIDGIRLSGAKKAIFPHSDLKALRAQLEARREDPHLKVIVIESLYGMEGDRAPIRECVELAEEFSALLVVDEAHATGLWGDFDQNRGGGLVQSLGLSDRVFATVHPGGKAFGVGGAWVCGDARLKDFLVNCSRSMIFSTAPMPILAAGLVAASQYWKEVGKNRAQILLERAKDFRSKLRESSAGQISIPSDDGLIVPVIVGENNHTLKIAQRLQESGFDVRAIRPPTVPLGSARLRLTLNWHQSTEDLERLARELIAVLLERNKIKEICCES